jgi:hypothetical protein
MFDHEKECSGAFRQAEGKKTKVGRFHEDLFDLMTEWPETKRLVEQLDLARDEALGGIVENSLRIERAEGLYAELYRGLIEASARIEALEKLHGK